MAAGSEEEEELKFRLYDGSDIGPFRYSPTSTVAMLKERIFSDWPKERMAQREAFHTLALRSKAGSANWNLIRFCIMINYLEILLMPPIDAPFRYVVFAVGSVRGLYRNCNLDKKIAPKTANDIKLISAGKIMGNNKTVAQCKAPFGELLKGTITMHVVVQPPLTKPKPEKKMDEPANKSFCSCSIL